MTPRLRVALIAFFLHVPGLMAFGRDRLPPRLLVPNMLAVSLTAAIAVGLGWRHHLWAGIAAWAAGHVLWGAYLSWRVWSHRS
jgi:hypothetical protein